MIRTIDIIIPVYRPDSTFGRLLAMLKKQTRPFSRLILINTLPEEGDNSSEVEDLVRSFFPERERCELKHIPKDAFDHAGTRRMAVGLSGAEAFICMTDDALPADEYLIEKLACALESGSRIAVAYARQLAREDADPAEQYTRQFNYPAESRIKSMDDVDKLGIKTFFASNVCCAYNRSIYDTLGGFVENAIFNEDMIYAGTALENGYLSYYMADAMVYHSHSYSVRTEFCRNFDNGLSQAMHPEIFGGLSSEGEGIRLVKNTCAYLFKSGHALSLPDLIVRSAAKYLGFRLGKAYRRLPAWLIIRLALNKSYIRKYVK